MSQEREDIDKEHQKKKQRLKLLEQQAAVWDEEMAKKNADLENKLKVMERMMQQNEDLKKEN